jgi:hypothetical protein
MTEQANIPDVVAEVTDSFERYNKAIESGDSAALNSFFWNSPLTVRFGPREHLASGFVRERDRQNFTRCDALLEEECNAMRQNSCLARSRASQREHRSIYGSDRRSLCIVQSSEQILHRVSFRRGAVYEKRERRINVSPTAYQKSQEQRKMNPIRPSTTCAPSGSWVGTPGSIRTPFTRV